ncbi:MAG TPA: riboflavin synthase [Vicinamibacteria bacterium]|nr:riboflavin synthase [Vicinamibacteria bacterium]
MFTGIVEETGTVRSAEPAGEVLRVEIAARSVLDGLTTGGSISVNGCCLTAVAVGPDGFACELTRETLARTAFGERLRPGTRVNLERPLRADGRFDGHIVQGHVDGLGRVAELNRQGEAAELVVAPPPELERYLVEKGSVAVDGISLTVAARGPGSFTAAIIPYTLSHTNLAQARPGDRVNLEVDILAKYVERLLQER